MFSDEILEKIFTDESVNKVPLVYQSIMIRAVENALDEIKKEKQNDDY